MRRCIRPTALSCLLLSLCASLYAEESVALTRQIEQELTAIGTLRDGLVAKAQALPGLPGPPLRLTLTLSRLLLNEGKFGDLVIHLRRTGGGRWLAGDDWTGNAYEADGLRLADAKLHGTLRVLGITGTLPHHQRVEATVEISAAINQGEVQGNWTTSGHPALPVLPRNPVLLNRIPAQTGHLTGTMVRLARPDWSDPKEPAVDLEGKLDPDEQKARWLDRLACERYRQSLAALLRIQQELDLAHALELCPIYRPLWDAPADAPNKVGKTPPNIVVDEMLEDSLSTTSARAKTDLAAMQAILTHVRQIRGALERSESIAPFVQTPCPDPDFGPWFGEDLLPADPQGRHVLAAMPVGSGAQSWARLDRWNFVGPFPYRFRPPYAALPDLVPLPGTSVQVDGPLAERIDRICGKQAEQSPDEETVSPHRAQSYGWGSTVVPMGRQVGQDSPCPALSVYAHTVLVSPAAGTLWAGLNLPAGGALWVNDRLVWQDAGPDDPCELERVYRFQVPVEAGANRILVRIDRRQGHAVFALRVCLRGAPRDTTVSRLAGQPATEGLRGWRGDWSGRMPQANPPLAWDLGQEHNVRWEVPLGISHASPVIIKDRVYVMEDPATLVCIQAATGKLLWRRLFLPKDLDPKVAEALRQEFAKLEAHSRALEALGATRRQRLKALAATHPEQAEALLQEKIEAILKPVEAMRGLLKEAKVPGTGWWNWTSRTFPTPVSDGRHLWLWANAEVVASCDLDGTTRWVTSHPKRFGIQSPVLSGGRLIVCSTRFGQTTGGMVTGFDAQTGERVWEVETGLGTPVTDISTGNCGSPLPLVLGQGPDTVAVVVTENGSVIRSRDGAILRQHLGIKEVYGTPIAMGPAGVLFSPQRHHAGYDLLLDETGQVGTRLRWHRRRVHAGYNPADYQLLDDNLLYHHGVRLDVHDVATGAPISTQAETQWNRSGAPFVAPVLAGRHLYVGDLGCITKSAFRDGGMSVATAGPVPLLLSRNRIRQLSNGPVADGDCLYVRQWHSLLCLGPTGPAGERYAAETVASELLSTLPPQPLPGPPVKATDPLNQDDAKSSRNMLIPTVVPGGWVVVGPVPEARGEDLRRLLLRLPAERFLGVQQPGRLDQDGLSAALIPVPGLGTEDEAYIASKDHMQYNRASFKAAQERGLALGSPVWARNLIASNFHSPIPGGELVLKPATLLPGGRLMLLTIVAPSTAGPLRWCEAGPGIRAWLDELELTHGLAVEMDQRPRRLMIELRPEAAERTYRPCFWYSQDETKDLAIWRAAVAQRRTYFDTLLAKAPDSPLAAIVRGILAAVGP